MKLYIVIYMLGEIVGSIGPLDPLTMDQCWEQAGHFQIDADKSALEKEIIHPNGQRLLPGDMVLKCERLAERPVLKNPVTP